MRSKARTSMGTQNIRSFTPAKTSIIAATSLLLLMCSCSSNQNTPTFSAARATVLMRDGTSIHGAVTGTSPSQITVASEDGATHTFPMTQVKSIDYDDVATTPLASATSSAPAAAPASSTPPVPARTVAAKAESDPAHERHYHPTRDEIHTRTYQLAVGTDVSVRTEEAIDSGSAAEGQTYAAEIVDDVLDADNNVVIPHGSNAQIVIRSASKGNRFRGTSDLVLDLRSISVEGQQYMISTTDLRQSGKEGFGANKRTAEYTGGGAALGAIIGAIAGHGKGAAIGAGAGAGGGALTQILTKGGSIRVPAESVLSFKLDRPVQIVAAK
jgi:hypothetical protein